MFQALPSFSYHFFFLFFLPFFLFIPVPFFPFLPIYHFFLPIFLSFFLSTLLFFNFPFFLYSFATFPSFIKIQQPFSFRPLLFVLFHQLPSLLSTPLFAFIPPFLSFFHSLIPLVFFNIYLSISIDMISNRLVVRKLNSPH